MKEGCGGCCCCGCGEYGGMVWKYIGVEGINCGGQNMTGGCMGINAGCGGNIKNVGTAIGTIEGVNLRNDA